MPEFMQEEEFAQQRWEDEGGMVAQPRLFRNKTTGQIFEIEGGIAVLLEG